MNIKEIKNNNKKLKVEKKVVEDQEKKTFKRILIKFRQYWRILVLLMVGYIIGYMIWVFISGGLSELLSKRKLDGNVRWVAIFAAIFQGLLFCMDGFVTSLLKSPFSQMNQNINASNLITEKEKDYLTFRNTNSNENCKETLKKFGILTVATELVKVFIKNIGNESQEYQFEHLLVISYLIPLSFVLWDLWQASKMLKKIKNRLEKGGISFLRPNGKKNS
jgi:MFS family permease